MDEIKLNKGELRGVLSNKSELERLRTENSMLKNEIKKLRPLKNKIVGRLIGLRIYGPSWYDLKYHGKMSEYDGKEPHRYVKATALYRLLTDLYE